MEEIKVPVQWFVRLLEIKKLTEAQLIEAKVSPEGLAWLHNLLGYIESAEDFVPTKT